MSNLQHSREPVAKQEHVMAPAFDVFENKDELVLVSDLPGAQKNDVELHLHHGELTIQAKVSSKVEGATLMAGEFASRIYRRSFTIPVEIDSEHIVADFQRGVLTLRLPKTEAAKPKKIAITVPTK